MPWRMSERIQLGSIAVHRAEPVDTADLSAHDSHAVLLFSNYRVDPRAALCVLAPLLASLSKGLL